MASFGDAIKYLYGKFILRDVLSFITPGAIIVLSGILLFNNNLNELHTIDIPWPLYIPIFGIFFLVGFATQCFGELVGVIRHTPHEPNNTGDMRHQILRCRRWYEDSEGWWHESHIDMINFINSTNNENREILRERHERFTVLKQMCANNFFAIISGGIFIGFGYCNCTSVKILVTMIMIITLLISLLWGYRVHTLKEADWRNVIINDRTNSERNV